MNCWEYRDFVAHATGPGEEATPVAEAAAAHLARCRACREFAEHWTAVGPLLERWPAPGPAASAAARAELAARLAAPPRRPAARPGWAFGRLLRVPVARPLSSAVAVAALLAAAVLAWHGRGPAPGRRPVPERIVLVSPPVQPASASPTRGASADVKLPTPAVHARARARARSDQSDQSDRSDQSDYEHEHERVHERERERGPLREHRPAGVVDDLAAINADPEATLRQWAAVPLSAWERIEARIRRSVRVRDDFVRIPFPRIAAASPRLIAEAVEGYKKEAAIVDPRLARDVTLAVKAMAFSDLCDHLRADTGIEISAGPSVADEKVTIFCEKRPLREIMREITHVFGFTWLRSGEEGKYRYELTQDLRSQLAEEQFRNQDVQQALLDLDKQMSIYRPYLDQSVDQLLARLDQLQPGWEKLSQEEKGRLWTLLGSGNLKDLAGVQQYPLVDRLVKSGGWGPAMLYFRLSPAERSALLAGGRLEFSMDNPNPERRLPAEWRVPLLKSTDLRVFPSGVILQPYGAPPDKPSTPVDQAPNTEPVVRLELDRSEAGELTLKGGTYVNSIDPSTGKIIGTGGSAGWTMATGRSPSTTKPDNAAADKALRTRPPLRRVIDLEPKPSCPRLAADAERARKGEPDPLYQSAFDPALSGPHVNTADVWEAIHQRTGLPVVADSYLHAFPLDSVTVKHASTFDALCQVADQIGVRWKKEGDFLLGRSTSYFWDELKEVPNRLLRRWQQDSRANNGLPLSDLLEMASLSDQQLGSKTVGLPICHCWELDEWQIVGTGPMLPLSAQRLYGVDVRKYARALSLLTPAQLQQAQQPDGVLLSDLKATPREAVLERFQWLLSDLPAGTPLRLHVDYIPSGCFIWSPLISMAQFKAGANRWPTVWGTSVEKGLAAARRYDPNAEAGSIRPTGGRLDFTFVLPDGKRLSTGGPAVMVETE